MLQARVRQIGRHSFRHACKAWHGSLTSLSCGLVVFFFTQKHPAFILPPSTLSSSSTSILCVLSFSMRLLETGKTTTQREIYYAFVKHFANQVWPKHGRACPPPPSVKYRSATRCFRPFPEVGLPSLLVQLSTNKYWRRYKASLSQRQLFPRLLHPSLLTMSDRMNPHVPVVLTTSVNTPLRLRTRRCVP